jgi:hypothetical protein
MASEAEADADADAGWPLRQARAALAGRKPFGGQTEASADDRRTATQSAICEGRRFRFLLAIDECQAVGRLWADFRSAG